MIIILALRIGYTFLFQVVVGSRLIRARTLFSRKNICQQTHRIEQKEDLSTKSMSTFESKLSQAWSLFSYTDVCVKL